MHDSGKVDNGATFKWQRDNGTIVVKATDITEKTITVTGIGRDKLLGFSNQQWVEVIDDRHELLNQPGTIVKIVVVSESELAVIDGTVKGEPLTNDNFPQTYNPKVRRWDSVGADIPITIPALNEGYIEIEDGIEVRFQSRYYEEEDDEVEGRLQFRTGDYWNIPARTLKGNIEWPRDGDGNPVPRLPDGIVHHYSRLAILEFADGKLELKADCRRIFPPLTDIEPATPSPQSQIPKIVSTWMHGNAVWIEDPRLMFDSVRKGEGASFVLKPTGQPYREGTWFHFPLSTSFAFEKVSLLLSKIHIVFKEVNENAKLAGIIIFDGPKSVGSPLDLIPPPDPSIASIRPHPASGNSILTGILNRR